MNDQQIRNGLRNRLIRAYAERPDTIIVDELGLCAGHTRADLVVVNGSLTGFEIKSDRDSLVRLKNQVSAYSRVFDYATLVVAGRHLDHAAEQVPSWWGIETVQSWGGRGSRFHVIRPPKRNESLDPLALAQLLWRDEVLEILISRNRIKQSSRLPRRILWNALIDAVPLEQLRRIVRTQLRTRPHWRADRPQTSGGGRYQPFAK